MPRISHIHTANIQIIPVENERVTGTFEEFKVLIRDQLPTDKGISKPFLKKVEKLV